MHSTLKDFVYPDKTQNPSSYIASNAFSKCGLNRKTFNKNVDILKEKDSIELDKGAGSTLASGRICICIYIFHECFWYSKC